MAKWIIDQAHSEIKFKVKHLVISTVTGQFGAFEGSVESDRPDFSDARIRFEADVNSITTRNDQRDGHLKSPDFFDVANHPKMSFVSSSFVKKGDDRYELTGDLTMRGNTRQVRLETVYNGTVKGFDGNIAAFEISGKLSRKEFGLLWNALTETGGVAVGDEVKLDITVELKEAVVEEPVAV
jgi:polyisoprenoid-binding protein YceI